MKNELYIYACPKLSDDQGQSLNVFPILCVTLFSSLSLFFGNIGVSVVIMTLYVGLSLLTFLDKDIKSRYMKLIMLCAADISFFGLYIIAKFYPDYKVILWSIIFAIVFFIIYEVVVIIKIKKTLYSSPSDNDKTTVVVGALGVLIFTRIFRILRKIPIFQNLVVSILILLGSAMLTVSMMLIQKLIIYLCTRDKIIDEKK